ncbi:HpcH/HpaI aldolase family protein [Mameliella sp.]|uniref:HpcH/HpaI aldolase family protein n=1 Tax=Mameliella sp. TaxID=1924940 RepID=UPI003BAC7292
MTMIDTVNRRFKADVHARKPLLGAFVKTPHPIVVEVMAGAGYDFLVLDCEHAPFDRGTLDTLIFTGRALGCAMVVRVPVGSPDWLLFVLDAGAAGVMVPHVNTVPQAETLAQAMRYGPGGRGFAGTTRAAHYADRSMTEHMARTPQETVLIAQIEDPEGAENVAGIAAVAGVDALFVGRADLAVGYGINDFHAERIGTITREVLGQQAAATGLYCAPGEDLSGFAEAGGSLFVIGSEHSAIRAFASDSRALLNTAASAPETQSPHP